MAYRLAARLAGPVAGLIAAISLFLADEFIRNFCAGNSEGLLVALCLWAIERHLDGRRRDAFLLGLAAALLRPEVWPFFALYGLCLIADRPRAGAALVWRRARARAAVVRPEYLGSGDFLRAADRARHPNPDSAAFAASPFLEVFMRSASCSPPRSRRRRDRGGHRRARRRESVALALAAVASVLMIAVAAMTQAGFAGNLRYVALPAALVCVLAGPVGWGSSRGAPRGGAGAPPARAPCRRAAWTPFGPDSDVLALAAQRIAAEADFNGALPGRSRPAAARRREACGTVFTGAFQMPALA